MQTIKRQEYLSLKLLQVVASSTSRDVIGDKHVDAAYMRDDLWALMPVSVDSVMDVEAGRGSRECACGLCRNNIVPLISTLEI